MSGGNGARRPAAPARAGRRRVPSCPAARRLALAGPFALLAALLALAAPFLAAPAAAQTWDLSIGFTISNNQARDDATGVEGDIIRFTVFKGGSGSGDVTVKWRFVPGTAGAGDYDSDDTTEAQRTLSLPTNRLNQVDRIDLIDDIRYEGEETFHIELYDASSNATIVRSQMKVTIRVDPNNPDNPIFVLDDTAVSVDEDDGAAEVRVRIDAFAPQDADTVTVPWTVIGGTATAGDDFDAAGGTLSFPAGLSTATARIPIVNDPWPEEAETFEVRFGTPSAGTVNGASTATVTIPAHEERAEAVAASISSTPASGDTYLAGETVTVSLALNGATRVTGRPYIWLDIGGSVRRADYSGPVGDAVEALEFSYLVHRGDRDADGVASPRARSRGCAARSTTRS